jgi:hypothetical protein
MGTFHGRSELVAAEGLTEAGQRRKESPRQGRNSLAGRAASW